MPDPKAYSDEVHNQLHLYASWLPTTEIAIGMVGVLHGKLFTPIATLADYGITTTIKTNDNTDATYKIMSSGVTEAAAGAAASATAATVVAGMNVSFSKARSVYFSLRGCTGTTVEDIMKLGQKIIHKAQTNQWPLDHVVVTGVVAAKSATILQADSANASFALEESGAAPTAAGPLKASASVSAGVQTWGGLSIVTKKGLTPLFSLSKVNYTLFDRLLGSDPTFYAGMEGTPIKLNPFMRTVDAIPGVDLKDATSQKGVVLTVKLPKSGEHVNIGNLVHLTARTATLMEGGLAHMPHIDYGKCHWNYHVPGEELARVVNKLSYVQVDHAASNKKFIGLSVTLPKKGSSVRVKPLGEMVAKIATRKASPQMGINLSFGEIE